MLVKPILAAVGAVTAGRFTRLDTLTLRTFNDALVDASVDLPDGHLPGIATVLMNTLPEVGVGTRAAPGLVRLGRRLSANTQPDNRLHHVGHLLSAYGHSVTDDIPELIKCLIPASHSPLAPIATYWLSNLLQEGWHLVQIGGDAERVRQIGRTMIANTPPTHVIASEGHLLMAALHERLGERDEFELHLASVRHPAVTKTQLYRDVRLRGTSRDFGLSGVYEQSVLETAAKLVESLDRVTPPTQI